MTDFFETVTATEEPDSQGKGPAALGTPACNLNILAIDIGTTTGWALGMRDGALHSGSESFAPRRNDGPGQRWLKFAAWLGERARQAGEIHAVYYELVLRHTAVQAAHVYGGFEAHLQAWADRNRIRLVGVPVPVIKKAATGKGNADKNAMMVAMRARGYLFFVQLDFSQPLRVCSAGYNVDWNGATWLGLGSLGSIEPIQEQASLEATGVRLTLTGVPTEYVAIMLAEQYQGRPCQIWFAPLREDLQIGVSPIRLFSGRMDVPVIDVGDTASIAVSAESRMVAWDRAKTRRYNHEDQISRYPGDLGFIYVSQMVEKQLVWGR